MRKVINVDAMGKAYKQYGSKWSRLIEWFVPFSGKRHTEHWVLKNISFSVCAGEALGIVGINGAGKSTLLKIVAGTVQPTVGNIEISGRVSALLELGMGFHPEFTGRQNVFMSGQLLGLKVDEIARMMPEIESFAEIGAYIDQPVRTYSSGMQVRLAFSVATAVRPDVLIVDEALSVGDVYFQHKSFERIKAMRDDGTALLIVSHDRLAIQSLCDRALLLHEGGLAKDGGAEEVMDFYHALLATRQLEEIQQIESKDGVKTISGSQEIIIESCSLLNERGDDVKIVAVGEGVTIKVLARALTHIDQVSLGFMIKDRFGQPVYGINSFRLGKPVYDVSKGELVEYCFSFDINIGAGNYSMAFALSKSDSHVEKNYEWRDRGLVFQVINQNKEDFVGCAWLNAELTINRQLCDD